MTGTEDSLAVGSAATPAGASSASCRNTRRDWEWRRRIRANPNSHRIYRVVVGVVGLIIFAGGLLLVPFPGPGWAIVFLGIAVWASEFAWAQRLLRWGKSVLARWNRWILSHGWGVRSLVALGTLIVVLGVFWVLFKLTGVPTWLPDPAEAALQRFGGL